MALTDTVIRNAKPLDKSYKLFDERGLFIQIAPTGGKWWRFKFRFEGKEQLISLGTYPEVSLAFAREQRDAARKLIAAGVNPSANRKASKAAKGALHANTFEVIAREWVEYHMKDKAESHRDRTLKRFEVYLFPWIGNKPAAEITAPELLFQIKRIQSQNKLETAHRVLQSAGQVFRYAVQTGRAVRDITTDLRGALPSTTEKHMASFTDPKDVAELLNAIDGFKGSFTVQTALKLAPLVFVRPGELRTARWADIDLKSGEWRYVVSKTKTDHIVPLSEQALALLNDIFPVSGHAEFVFQGGHNPQKPMSEAAINAALKRMGYDTQTQITGHGFRAMARTLLHERLGIDPHVIEHQLAHKVPDALGVAYNRTKFLEQRKEMMQAWADYLDKLKAN